MIGRLNPFRSLTNPKEVWAWGMYDLANQSFTLLIITLLFPLYFKEVVIGGDASLAPAAADAKGDWYWSVVLSASLFLVVILSPLVGAMLDVKQWRKEFLIVSGLCCATLTCSLAVAGPSVLAVAAALFMLANIAYQLGENTLASFLPDVSTSRNIGKVSAIGWSMGYIGALILLGLVAVGMQMFDVQTKAQWRPFFAMAGVWFGLGMIPAMLFLRERKRPVTYASPMKEAARRLTVTVTAARRYRQLLIFLLGFFIYAFGVQSIIAFASIIAENFGFIGNRLVLFVLQITVTAGIAAVATSFFQDRIGAKRTIIMYLCIWIASSLGMAWLTYLPSEPQWAFWLIGNGLGFGLGGIGTASRAMVGRLTPAYRSAEFFGLWGLSYKMAGAIGVISFGFVKSQLSNRGAFFLLAAFFFVGLLIVLLVNERAGLRQAQREERDFLAIADKDNPGS